MAAAAAFRLDTLFGVGDSAIMKRRLLQLLVTGWLLALRLCVYAEPLNTSVLTNIAARYNLPMPPKGARLVLAHTETWQVLGNHSTSRDPAVYSPAFLLEENTNGSIVVLRGAERETLDPSRSEPLWRPFSTTFVKPRLGGYVVSINRLSAFVCAVQLAAQGEEAKAQQIWEAIENAEFLDDETYLERVKPAKSPPLLLGGCLYEHLRKQILEQPVAWPEIRERMAALLDEFPALKNAERSGVLEGLTAAVQAKPPAPGSIEALVLDWSRRTGSHFPFDNNTDADAPAYAVMLRGADAVPDLIELLNDRRLSTHEYRGPMQSGGRIETVGELAGRLLNSITGIDAFWSVPTNPAPFREWLAKAHAKGEAEALAESVFVNENGKITWVNETPVRILAEKYPERLLPLCAEFTEDATPEAQPFALANAIAQCRLAMEIRVRTLAEFAQKGSRAQKLSMLESLATIDQKRCAELLMPVLNGLPNDITNEYWTCPEAHFASVVAELDDVDVWRSYLRVAQRCSVGLRLEMMESMECCCCSGEEKNHDRRLAFLASFLDDKSERYLADDDERFSGPCAASTIPRIAVRDFAAMQIASIMRLPERPDEFWTFAQWRDLRRKVREKLTEEKIKSL